MVFKKNVLNLNTLLLLRPPLMNNDDHTNWYQRCCEGKKVLPLISRLSTPSIPCSSVSPNSLLRRHVVFEMKIPDFGLWSGSISKHLFVDMINKKIIALPISLSSFIFLQEHLLENYSLLIFRRMTVARFHHFTSFERKKVVRQIVGWNEKFCPNSQKSYVCE